MTDQDKPRLSTEQATLAMFKQLCQHRDMEIAKRKRLRDKGLEPASEPEPLERLRFTRNKDGEQTIDLTKADPACARCGGTGRRPDRRFHDEASGKTIVVPVVCSCVHRNGGVEKDMLDRMLERQKRQPKPRRRKPRRRKRGKKR